MPSASSSMEFAEKMWYLVRFGSGDPHSEKREHIREIAYRIGFLHGLIVGIISVIIGTIIK